MKYTDQIAQKYLGTVDKAWMVYAADENVRDGAASGGAVSALLIHLLQAGEIDGAVVTRIKCEDGIGCEVVLARDEQTILSARTSKYTDVPVARETKRLLRDFEGKVAIVALPCHATILRKMAQKDPVLKSKIKYIISLFCGHSCRDELLSGVLLKRGIDPKDVGEFYFRKGRWRGNMQGKLRDGTEFGFPFKRFSYYHNVNFFCLTRCLSCHDHTGYEADFCVGDAWLREMKKEPIKHSIIFSRNGRGTEIVEKMLEEQKFIGRGIDKRTVFRAQKRALIYHYNVTARAKAARLYKMKIKDPVNTKVRWNDWLAGHIIMLNYRLSKSPRGQKWVFRIPWPIIYLYFLFLKFLQNF